MLISRAIGQFFTSSQSILTLMQKEGSSIPGSLLFIYIYKHLISLIFQNMRDAQKVFALLYLCVGNGEGERSSKLFDCPSFISEIIFTLIIIICLKTIMDLIYDVFVFKC